MVLFTGYLITEKTPLLFSKYVTTAQSLNKKDYTTYCKLFYYK